MQKKNAYLAQKCAYVVKIKLNNNTIKLRCKHEVRHKMKPKIKLVIKLKIRNDNSTEYKIELVIGIL